MQDNEQNSTSSAPSESGSNAEGREPADERGRALLVSFAMLQVRWDQQNNSYIDNFVPFVAHCVKASGSAAVATSEVQRQLMDRFGLAVPQYALSTIIKRGSRQGLFRLKDHRLLPNEEALQSVNVDNSYQRAERGYRQLLGKFLTFVKDRYDRELDQGQVDDAFLAYVTDRALPIVRSTLLGREFQPHLANLGELEVMVAEFIVHLSHEDVEGFDLLDMIVRGCILATALYLPDPNDRDRKVTDLTVYFDTPLIIDLIGLTDEARQEAACELVKLLKDLGARVACFSHTLQETENVIFSSSQMLSANSTNGRQSNEIVSTALSRGWGRTNLEMKATSVEDDLSGLGFSVRDAPDYRIRTTLDEVRMEDVLQTVVGYARPETRLYDVKSLASIWQLRDARSQRHLESARAVFVTSNTSLVRASAQFFNETPNGFDVPVATLDSHLGTVAWLKKPMAAPDLPRRQLVADCIAALEPGTRLWERFLEVVDQLHADGDVSEEDYATLRYTVSARQALVEETLGDEGALTVGSVSEILRRAKEKMTREAQELLKAEIEIRQDAQASAERQMERAVAAEKNLSSARQEHANELRNTEETNRQELARRIGNKAHRRAVRMARIIYILLALVVIGGALSTAGLIGGGIAFALVVATALLSTRHILVGESLSDIESRVERFLERKFEELERRSLGIQS